MRIDLSSLIESLQSGLSSIPPVAIALVLLAGPTAALIVYRLISVTRRIPATPEAEIAPFWVCHDCRSVNQLRVSRCYRCGAERDAAEAVEVIVEQPASRPSTFEAPAGSPFAALGTRVDQAEPGPGIPVMADWPVTPARVAVGPGRSVEAAEPARDDELAAAEERRP